MNRNFQDSTDVSLPILWVLEWNFPLGVSEFCKNKSKLPISNKSDAHFFCGQDSLLGWQFWAMGRFNLLGGQSNLLGGQMPTQLTCYLPPWCRLSLETPTHFKGQYGRKKHPLLGIFLEI